MLGSAAQRPFSGAALDRVSVQRKDPGWVAEVLRAPERRGIVVGRDQVLIAGEGSELSLARLEPTDDQLAVPILLGLAAGVPLFAIDLEREAMRDRPADDGSWDRDGEDAARLISLREAGIALPHAEAGLAAYATALLAWHRRHGFCANCGQETKVVEAGFERRCPRCGAHHFPRTDPVVIMTVEHEDRLLLGRRAGWPEGRLSVLAGFIAPGESVEEAVMREVEEESGIVCHDPVYVTSQPWPFPASLMLGLHAWADGGVPTATDGELEEVHWIPRERVRAAAQGEDAGFALPGEVSIARFLIERWVAAHPR
ncbi:MAG TPA: NAD(+) diphosphatase [Solirubrobacteraceae bacterium]|nr:NAD(+) diphosphatase [Solirubrobacteraceae bacterium]